MAEIRDASLRKGIVVLCEACNNTRVNETEEKHSPEVDYLMNTFFGNKK